MDAESIARSLTLELTQAAMAGCPLPLPHPKVYRSTTALYNLDHPHCACERDHDGVLLVSVACPIIHEHSIAPKARS